MKRLIVNADDFGYTRSVNLGIVRGFREGIITSATIMGNGAAFEDAVEGAKANSELGVGCHLVLIGGKSVAPAKEIPGLADSEGNLPATWAALLKKLSGHKVKGDEIACELRAQVTKVFSAGIQPTHFDCHKHTHAHPRVMEQVARVAEEFGIRRVRMPFENVGSLASAAFREGAWTQGARGILAHAAAKRFRQIVRNHNLLVPDQFWGVGATGNLSAKALLAMISSMPEGTNELMCHPGECDAGLERADTRLKRERERELEALTDPSVRAALVQHHIELMSYRGLN